MESAPRNWQIHSMTVVKGIKKPHTQAGSDCLAETVRSVEGLRAEVSVEKTASYCSGLSCNVTCWESAFSFDMMGDTFSPSLLAMLGMRCKEVRVGKM